jgi:hypothetical protein
VLSAPDAFSGLPYRVVDIELVPGGPEGDRMKACLIYQTRADADGARRQAEKYNERVRSILTEAGFDTINVRSLVVRFTFEPEIEERGGRFYFFR